MANTLLLGDCLERMREIPDGSVDSVVTDPPAGISFMGKDWDGHKGGRAGWVAWLAERMREAYRVARPGTYALVWALPRTSHWTATAIEDAGWTIRDRVTYLFGTGFPKAKSCLKPGAEDWWLAYKPGGKMSPLQIDACRIGMSQEDADFIRKTARPNSAGMPHVGPTMNRPLAPTVNVHPSGRWPANVVLDGSDEVLAAFPQEGRSTKPSNTGGFGMPINGKIGPTGLSKQTSESRYVDSGSAARFFYTAKASRSDRGPGNDHPTVKSADLMRWLCRLITPPGGTVLDPFMGSGSTGKACAAEGFGFVGIEQDPAYFSIAERRIADARPTPLAAGA